MTSMYTADIAEGKEVSFKDFMIKCAMDIDFNYRGHDLLMAKGELPVFKPDTDRIKRSIELAKQRLEVAKNQSLEELEAYLTDQHEIAVRMYNEQATEKEQLRQRYQAMLDKVEAWIPPTSMHETLKKNAIKHLQDSIDVDCKMYQQAPVKEDPAEYKQYLIDHYTNDIEQQESRLKRQIDAADASNEWNYQLLKSIVAVDPIERIEGIIGTGYYLNSNEDTLHPHTTVTSALFQRALEAKSIVTDHDVLEIVTYDFAKESWAGQWYNTKTGRETIYFK